MQYFTIQKLQILPETMCNLHKFFNFYVAHIQKCEIHIDTTDKILYYIVVEHKCYEVKK